MSKITKTSLHKKILQLKKKHFSKGFLPGATISKLIVSLVIVGLIGLLGGFIFMLSLISNIPDIPTNFDNAQSTIIYDREGNILYTIHGEENRQEVPLSEIPKHVIDATIAIEDDQFFEHHGFDIGGIIKGFFAEYLMIGKRRGGSTITQQLVKNTLLTPERTMTRKIKEILLSIQLERTYNKNEILSMYLNTIPYGSNAYGIEMAARIYFDTHTQNLTLAQAAILAALPQAPSRYNPYGNGKDLLMGGFDEEGNYVSGRKDLVLNRMEELNFISDEERIQAFEEASQITFKQYREDIKYPHLVLYVKELLENKFGKEAIETGGLHVYTTIDPRIQDKAESVIQEQMQVFPERYGANNTAVLTVDLERGHILAMVGSADYFNEEIDGNVNVVFRKRLPGSSFKPIVYATGFARGYSPATILYDLETDFGNDYIPQNYDGLFHGPVSARYALAHSLNIPAVKMAFLSGIDNVITQAKKMGITDLLDSEQYGTSIGLGTGEATLYQMVTAFSTFAKGGQKIAFTPILRIESSDGKIIESNEELVPNSKEVLDPQIAYTINHILSDQTARPADWSRLQIDNQINATKTGTSNKRVKDNDNNPDNDIKPMDNWTIGYTTKIVTGVWVGNNDSSPLKYTAAGLTTAARIWNPVMTEATKLHELEEFPKPKGISWMKVSRRSGLLPSPHTPEKETVAELFTTFNTPTEVDQTFLTIEIDQLSQKLPTEFTPTDSIVEALVANFHSQNPSNPDWEKPIKIWATAYLKNYNSEAIVLEKIPTEYDDIHTPKSSQNQPQITIRSPQNGSLVPPGYLEVYVDIQAPHGVSKIEYFLNQHLVETVTEYPYTGKIRLAKRNEGEEYHIGVTITDLLFYQTSAIVKPIASNQTDTTAPEISIEYPQTGAIFPTFTTLNINTKASDNISIDSVSFYLDDRLLGSVTSPPYNFTTSLPDEIAPHKIKVLAHDTSGNTQQDQVDIKIEEKDESQRAETAFIFPKPGSIFKKGKTPIDFFFQLSNIEQKNTALIQVFAFNSNTAQNTIISQTEVDQKASKNYAFAWVPLSSGEYQISIKTISNSNIEKTSPALTLSVD